MLSQSSELALEGEVASHTGSHRGSRDLSTRCADTWVKIWRYCFFCLLFRTGPCFLRLSENKPQVDRVLCETIVGLLGLDLHYVILALNIPNFGAPFKEKSLNKIKESQNVLFFRSLRFSE